MKSLLKNTTYVIFITFNQPKKITNHRICVTILYSKVQISRKKLFKPPSFHQNQSQITKQLTYFTLKYLIRKNITKSCNNYKHTPK